MTSTAPSTRRLERSTPSETAIRWPTTELLLRTPLAGRRLSADGQLTATERGVRSRARKCPSKPLGGCCYSRSHAGRQMVQKGWGHSFDKKQMREAAAMHAGAYARFRSLPARHHRLVPCEVNGRDASQGP